MIFPSLSAYAGFLCAFLLLSGSNLVLAQLGFTNVPATVNDGENVPVSWTGWDGVSRVQIDLIQNGAVVDEVSDDEESPLSTFTWQVDLDDDSIGGVYTLRLTSAGTTALSNPINVIDENGVGAPASTPAPSPATGATAVPSAAGSVATAATPGASSLSSTGLEASSAAIAATATTLITSTILENLVTITPSASSFVNTNATTDSSFHSDSGSSLSGGAIAGIVIGVLLSLALVILVIWYFRRRTQRSRLSHTSQRATDGFTGANGANEKANHTDGTYLQPAGLAAGATAGGAAGFAEGKGGTASELPNTSTALHVPPQGTHEMPTTFNTHSTCQHVPSQQMGSTSDGTAHKSPISELSASDDTATRQSVVSSGSSTSPIMSRGSPRRKDDGTVIHELG